MYDSFSGSTKICGPTEEKRKMHKQDTRVYARADSAIAAWAADESQDFSGNGMVVEMGKHFLFLDIDYIAWLNTWWYLSSTVSYVFSM